ncbi:MAG: hypothetical protein ACXVUE_13835 [Solirubrobacteraceae bacterium]
MRRIIFLATGLVVLIAASVALAATLNTYSAKLTFSPSKAGSKSHPVNTKFVETLTAKNANPSLRAGALTDIKTTIYGLVSNAKKFPTCDGNKISAMKTDTFCPKKALVATGPVNAVLGDNTLTGTGTPCNPFLHVWNGGGGKLWFFFTTGGKYRCATLHTGDTNAYPGTVKQQGKNQVTDVPLPPFVSTKVAGVPNFYGSLIKEVLTFTKGFNSSVGCKSGKRPWSVSFTAVGPQGKQTKVVKGSAKCS